VRTFGEIRCSEVLKRTRQVVDGCGKHSIAKRGGIRKKEIRKKGIPELIG